MGLDTKPFGPIQVIAPGLLGFLQLKDGRNPDRLSAEIEPVIEMRDWLMQARSQDSTNMAFTAPTGADWYPFTTPSSFTVPPSQAWYVWHLTMRASAGAGDTINDLRCAYRSIAGAATPLYHTITDMQPRVITGGATSPKVVAHAGGFWLQPGAELIGYIDCTAATTITVAGYLRYTPLPL